MSWQKSLAIISIFLLFLSSDFPLAEAQNFVQSNRARTNVQLNRRRYSNPRTMYRNGIVRTSTAAARSFNPFNNNSYRANTVDPKDVYLAKVAQYEVAKANWKHQVALLEMQQIEKFYQEKRRRNEEQRKAYQAELEKRRAAVPKSKQEMKKSKTGRSLSEMITDKLFDF